jgi:hypothetical protein
MKNCAKPANEVRREVPSSENGTGSRTAVG